MGVEGEHEVEETPGLNDYVGHRAVGEDQLPAIADTCRSNMLLSLTDKL